MPKVSVIIPSFNCAQFLPQALDSALKQTFTDFELLVVDDGSTDDTREIVETYQKRHPGKIRYFYQENQGLANARNTAIQNSAGEFLALLDADDLWLPERLEETVRVIESDEKIGLVHSNVYFVKEDGTLAYVVDRNLQYLSGPMFENIFLRRADVSCPTALFRKSCCNQVGMFDPNLARLGCEDREFWLRIAREYKVVYIDRVLANYRMRPTSMSRNRQKMLKARYYVVDKFTPAQGGNRSLRNLALSKIHRDLGDEFLIQEDYDNARREYLTGIRYHFFSFWLWVNLLKSILHLKPRKTTPPQKKT